MKDAAARHVAESGDETVIGVEGNRPGEVAALSGTQRAPENLVFRR